MKKPKKNLQKPLIPKKQDTSFSSKNWFQLAIILLGVFIIYSPILDKEFINHDDNWYIYENPFLNPFKFSYIGKIFSGFYSGQYSPLPMVVLGFIRMSAGNETLLYNLTAVLLHLINVSLTCWLVFRLGKNPFSALMVAALFGVCTLNMESIAWASAVFKIGFYAAFFLASLIAYTFYLSSNQIRYLLVSLILFVLSFLCKEQAVALVLCLLCIDFFNGRNLISKKVIAEKLPFLVLSIVFGVVTLMASRSNRDVLSVSHFTLAERILYACYALGEYIVKIFVPYKLAAFYPYPKAKDFSIWFYLHPVMIAGLLFIFIRAFRKNKIVTFGILFFIANILFTLALQIISVREVVMADRYVYVPCIGLFLIFASSLQTNSEKYPQYKKIFFSFSGIYLAVISVLTFQQAKVWKNTLSVMENSSKNYEAPMPLVNIGVEYMQRDSTDKAFDYFNRAIELDADYGLAYLNRGTIYINRHQDSLALADYDRAVGLGLNAAHLYANRGGIYIMHGKYDLALADFEKALKLKPNFYQAYYNRAIAHVRMNDFNSAVDDYSNYIQQNPNNAKVYFDRGTAYQNLQQTENAINDFSMAISMDNKKGSYYLKRSNAYAAAGRKEAALSDALAAQQLGEQVSNDYLESLRKK
jgi:tetratricopeptide (TPR) repeat protein